MNSLLAIFPPILAVATLVYLLKQLKLGNLFSPKAALSMATAGVGKLAGEDKQKTSITGSLTSAAGAAGNKSLRAWRNPHGRDVRRAAYRAIGRGASKTAHGVNDFSNLTTEERKLALKDAAASTADKAKGALTTAKDALTTKDGAAKAAASTAQVMSKLGVWALEEREKPESRTMREKTLAALKPLTVARDNVDIALEERQQRQALTAAVGSKSTPEEMEAVRAEYDAGRLLSLGAANRNQPYGSAFEMLTPDVASLVAKQHAAIAGGTGDQWLVDRATGTILPGTGPSLVPNLGSEEKTWEAAKHPALYFSNNKMLPGESQDDFTLRMTATGIVTGQLSSVTGEWKNALKEFNIPDTAEGRRIVMASTDPMRAPELTQRITLTTEQEARVQSVVESLKQTRSVQEAPAALSASVLSTDVRHSVNDVQALVESLRREWSATAGEPGRPAQPVQVQEIMARMDELASTAAETAKQIAATRATGTGSDASAASKAAADAAAAIEREVSGLSKKFVNAALGNGSTDTAKITAALDAVAHSLSFEFKKAEEEVGNRAQIEAAAQAKAQRVMQASSAQMSRGRRAPSVL